MEQSEAIVLEGASSDSFPCTLFGEIIVPSMFLMGHFNSEDPRHYTADWFSETEALLLEDEGWEVLLEREGEDW